MYRLIDDGPEEKRSAMEQILITQDNRFIAVFIELMRAAQIGLVHGVDYNALINALQQLSRQSLGDDWPAWVTWYGSTDLQPPPGFTGWKGALLSRIDPGFGEFLREDHPSRIRVEEIQWGGVPVVLVAQRGSVDVQGENRRVGPVQYSSGGEVRAFQRGSHEFSPGSRPDTVLDEQGRTWQVTEVALMGPGGERAPRLEGHLAYWFGWYAFFPNTLIYK